MQSFLFDNAILSQGQDALDFLVGLISSSTEYSIIGKDLNGTIVLWNEGARRIYGYASEDVVGTANSSILHTSEDIEANLPRKIMESALSDGKWEGMVKRVRKNG